MFVRRSIVGVVSIAIAIGGCGGSTVSIPPASSFPSATVMPTTAIASATPRASAPASVPPSAPAVRDQWWAAAPMLRPRSGFDAVTLGDGTVLAVGDDSACVPGGAEPGSERAELYDPAADAWTEVASLNKPRKIPATVPLPDGSAMVLGGVNSDDVPYSSTKVFAPGTRAWTDGPLMTVARGTPLAAALTDGKVLALSDRTGGTTGEIHDPRASSWTPVARLPPTTSIDHLIGLSSGRALAMGFHNQDSEPTPTAFVYDPERDTWTGVGSPEHFGYALVALRDGGALAIGGPDGGELFGGTGALTGLVSRFNPDTGRWAPVAPLSSPRMDPQVVGLADGRVLVAGGMTWSRNESEGSTVRTTELYDPETDRWSLAGDLLEPRKDGYAVALADGTVLVLGGDDDYNTEGDTPWCPEPMLTVERFAPGA